MGNITFPFPFFNEIIPHCLMPNKNHSCRCSRFPINGERTGTFWCNSEAFYPLSCIRRSCRKYFCTERNRKALCSHSIYSPLFNIQLRSNLVSTAQLYHHYNFSRKAHNNQLLFLHSIDMPSQHPSLGDLLLLSSFYC